MKNNDPALLCFEFESVYTRGLCQSFNIIASADIEQFYSFNASITHHGLGQLVAYSILNYR
jgi:lipoate-protein ligase B